MIESAVVKQIYLGDGQTTNFPFAFPFNEAEHVKVAIHDIATETETTITRDYYVDATASKVVYPGYPPGEEPPESERPGPLPAGKKLVIYRDTPINQLEDLGEKYPLPIIEEMVDKATLILQEIDEKADRAIKIGKGDTETPEELKDRLLKGSREAAASAAAAAQSAANAHNSAQAAAASEINAAASEQAATGSESVAAYSATLAQAWAESTDSPDGELDDDSPTGYTQSSKTWALDSKADAQYADEIAAKLEGIAAPFAWDPEATYNYPDVVAYTDGYTYRCVGTNVTGADVPGQSTEWVLLTYVIGAWELDANRDLMPAAVMIDDDNWDYDEHGDLMPIV